MLNTDIMTDDMVRDVAAVALIRYGVCPTIAEDAVSEFTSSMIDGPDTCVEYVSRLIHMHVAFAAQCRYAREMHW